VSFFQKDKHHLDLARLHKECEHNYRRFLKVPIDTCQMGASVEVMVGKNASSLVYLEVTEVTKYTSTLSMSAKGLGPQWLPPINIKARIYRDAKMVEIIEWCSDRTIPWELSERKGIQARDEKWQWNMFLSEILIYALRHGLAVTENP
jgi:uncharacterized protein YqiB (DUF1249 family)